MAVSSALCTSFKVELMTGTHNFTTTSGHVVKVALIKPSEAGTYGAASTNYSNITGNSDEASGTGYSAGGFAFTAGQNVTPTSTGTTAFTDWSTDPSWTSSSFSTVGCMFYNSSASNRAISVHTFSGTQTVTSGTLTLVLPTADSSNAIIRIA